MTTAHLIERTSAVGVDRIFSEAYFHYRDAIRLAEVDGQEYWGGEVPQGEHALLFRCGTFLASNAEQMVDHVLTLAAQPVQVVDEHAMHYCGTIDSEECMGVTLEDGRSIVMEYIVYDHAPEDRRDDPLYWLARWESGEFASHATCEEEEGNKPYCWVNIPGRRGNFDRPECEGEYINHI